MFNEDNDFIIKQVKDAASGIKSLFSNKSSDDTKIVFHKEDKMNIPFQKEIYNLIKNKGYVLAADRLFNLRYAMDENNFKKLCIWFYSKGPNKEYKIQDYTRNSLLSYLNKVRNIK